MKTVLMVFLFGLATAYSAAQQPALQQGVSVEMPTAHHAVEMRGADEETATVISVSEDGNVFVGAQPADVSSLNSLKPGVVYVKADARAPYQNVLTVLDSLQGRSVVLLTAPTIAKSGNPIPPYGLKLKLAD